MKLTKFLPAIMVGLASTSANAAMVYWEPTNADVNYVDATAAGFSLAMFDVDDFDGLQAAPLVLNPGADTIAISANGSNFDATSTVTANSTVLFNDAQFVLAMGDGVSWFEPVSWFEQAPGSNIYNITFSNSVVLSIDATPTLVPVPAAVWLFGSGLIGLVGVARRKTS